MVGVFTQASSKAGDQIVSKTYVTRVEGENTGVAGLSRKAAS